MERGKESLAEEREGRMEGYENEGGCSHGLLVSTGTGETERERERLLNSAIVLPRGCGIGVKQEDLRIPEGCSACCKSWTGPWGGWEPRFPGASLAASRSQWWGGLCRSRADPSQPPPPSPASLSLSPDQPRSCTLTGKDGGWTDKHPSGEQCCTPTPYPARTAGQCWGGVRRLRDMRLQLCTRLEPWQLLPALSPRPCIMGMLVMRRGLAGHPRVSEMHKAKGAERGESRRGCRCHRSPLAAGDAHAG